MKMNSSLREKLQETNDFLLTFEVVPGRNVRGKSVEKVLSFARQAAQEGLLDALSITDNPGGHPSLSPDVLGHEIKEMGIDAIVHFACGDWNRYGAFSRALQLDRLSMENLLIVTGDYPTEGPEGMAKPCFDLDSVTTTCMLDSMNMGAEVFCIKGQHVESEKTNFLLGTTVSCYKYAESEVLNQYYKLLKKVRNGANFAITQICYDARKLHELQQFLRDNQCNIPVFGSVYVLRKASAQAMHQGGVPGVSIPPKLLNMILTEAQAKDKGKSAAIIRAARLIAVLKGLGYRGAHIEGPGVYDNVRAIILHFKQIQDNWRDFLPEFDFPLTAGFYLYEKDNSTGLNSTRLAKKSLRRPLPYAQQAVMKAFHWLFFHKQAPHYGIIKRMAKVIDNNVILNWLFCLFENISKSVLFDCQKCGDCALDDMAYLCPESKCPKFMRNGSCGGSINKFCEVNKDKLCVWVNVYERLKAHNQQANLKNRCIPPRNWSLNDTSSWLNYYLDRDYHAAVLPFCRRIKKLKSD